MKKGKKKALCLLCCAALLSGCGSTLNAGQEFRTKVKEIPRTPLTILTDDESGFFAAAVDGYAAQHEELKVSLLAEGKAAAVRLRERVLSGAAPDVVYISSRHDGGVYRALAADGALRDLAPLAEGEGAVEFYPGFLDNPVARAGANGEFTGVPIEYNPAGLIAKEKRFAEAEAPRTFAAFTALEADGGRKLLGFPQDYPGFLEPLLLPLVAGAGGALRLNTDDYGTDGFSAQETLAVLEELASLEDLVFTAEPMAEMEVVYEAFKQDEVDFVPGDLATLSALQQDYGVQDALRFLAVPALGETQYVLVRLHPAYIPSQAAQPEEGLRFLQYLLSPDKFDSWYQSYGFIPPVKGSAAHQEGARTQAAQLFEEGAVAYCGTFAEDNQADGALLEATYVGLSELLLGNKEAADYAAEVDAQLAERAARAPQEDDAAQAGGEEEEESGPRTVVASTSAPEVPAYTPPPPASSQEESSEPPQEESASEGPPRAKKVESSRGEVVGNLNRDRENIGIDVPDDDDDELDYGFLEDYYR